MDDKNTILCRCEDLTREDILKCIQDGYRTIDEIKRVTRAGMGPCQGRTCRMLIAQELSSYYKLPLEEVLMPTFRPPVKPISIDVYKRQEYAISALTKFYQTTLQIEGAESAMFE